MPHFSMFGGHDGQLGPAGGFYVTLFGGADIQRPAAATQLAALQARDRAGGPPQYFFLTLFGGGSLSWPTLAEEYLALRDVLRSGVARLEDWDRLIGVHGASGGLRVHTLTLFGGFDADELPSDERELDDLALQRHLGHIPDEAVDLLSLAIGHRGVQRLAAVRRAVGVALAAAR